LRAAQALGNQSWNELFSGFVALDPNVNVEPDSSARSAYERLGRLFDEKLSQRVARERQAQER
jgi:hypothetical protein